MAISRIFPSLLASGALLLLASCNDATPNSAHQSSVAPGAPGSASTWAYAGKTAIGTSYEQYVNGQFSNSAATGPVSKVWFSAAQGIITETMYGLIHQAQLKDMQFYIKGPGFIDNERTDTRSRIEYLDTDSQGHPLSLAYKIINTDKDGLYTIEKRIITDPDRNTLVQQITFTAHSDDITAYLVANPHVNNTGSGDRAWSKGETAYAAEGSTTLALASDSAVSASVGFVGKSDLPTDLAQHHKVQWHYTRTGDTPGNVSLALTMPTLNNHQSARWNVVLGFGSNAQAANKAAQGSLQTGFKTLLARYNGSGKHIGWEDYLAGLTQLPSLAQQATDGGKLAYVSALVLKAQEDKTHAGAMIASLSNPWGDAVSAAKAATGYKAVWPRDFYQVAMALLALGDQQTPKVAYHYLKDIQVDTHTPGYKGTPGWFLQKTHVDGTLEWVGVQLDQTAMPIMLGWRLYRAGILSKAEVLNSYGTMLRSAADFLADGGDVSLGWNHTHITPPYTQQERWEEQAGYSPSTTAAVIAGLVSAAQLAHMAGDAERASHYLAKADSYQKNLQKHMFTTTGKLDQPPADGRYYLRINPNQDTAGTGALTARNGQPALNASKVVDPGFLELVRYGVSRANDKAIRASLAEVDDTKLPDYLRVRYTFNQNGHRVSGWRRYGGDGYGERTGTGAAYGSGGAMHRDQRGRVWPFLTGERGHYELAYGLQQGDANTREKVRQNYVAAMEGFANSGDMLSEQVWDGVGDNSAYHYTRGQGTDSATPLAWTHAEYLKLLRSLRDGKVWDKVDTVSQRYR